MQEVKVSEEYIDTVIDWIEEWGSKKSSMVIPQFLAEKGIGWKYFKQFLDISPKLHNAFQTVVCKLHSRWMDLAFEKKDLPRHLQAILMRYIKTYDDHAYEVEIAAKKEIAEETNFTFVKYGSENYAAAELQGIYKQMYNDNVNKRRS